MKKRFIKMLLAISGCLILVLTIFANNYYIEITGGDPILENWTNTSRLSTTDNWTEVVAIAGFKGNLLTSEIGANPQTIVTDSPGNAGNLTPNETNPNTSTAEGVVEFQIADPVVALRASDDADAPNLVVRINSVGCLAGKAMTMAYDVRDIDGSSRNSVSPIALQYRYSESSNYTSIPAAYIADATNGPNSATKLSQVYVVLPQNAINQPTLSLRIIGANAVGDDEFVGIDNIQVRCVELPSAAGANLDGKVTQANGRGISRAFVSIFNTANNTVKTTYTNNFGRYHFEDLDIGNLYILTVNHRRYTFPQNARQFEIFENIDDVLFVANEN